MSFLKGGIRGKDDVLWGLDFRVFFTFVVGEGSRVGD